MSGQATVRLSRRQTFRLLGGASATLLLAACGGATTPSPTVAPTKAASGGATTTTAATSAASSATSASTTTASTASATTATAATTSSRAAGSSAAASPAPAGTPAGGSLPTYPVLVKDGPVTIYDYGTKLPTGNVTFRWLDNGDQKAVFFKQYFAAYHKAHPNITPDYSALPGTEIQKVVPLGIQNGNAPDVFMLTNVPAAQLVREGSLMALDDVVPNFAAWKKQIPFGLFLPGVTDFNGKTYVTSFASQKRMGNMLLYNVAYMQQAGYDPATKPLNWDEFRAAAKKITEQGKGKYYGLIVGGSQTGQWSGMVSNLAEMAGAHGGDLNWQTGQYNYTTDLVLAAIDLFLGMKSDGSLFPGSVNLNAPQARAQMPQGAAGMILQGPWNVSQWQRENPDFNFGLAVTPLPNSGTPFPISVSIGGTNLWGIYAKSPYGSIAGEVFYYLGTLDGQRAWATLDGPGDPPIMPQAIEGADLTPRERTALKLGQDWTRYAPNPSVRNPDVAQVVLEMKTLSPDFGQTIQGLISGQLKDPKAAMKDLQDRAEAELQRAIKAAQAKGAKVSRDDWKFPNWDPMKDYTQDDYAALKG